MTDRCIKCNGQLPEQAGQGRPSLYCSKACRKSAELEVRRLNEQLARLEEEAAHARMFGPSSTVWRPPEVYQAELDRIEARLRALHEGDTTEERKRL